MTLQNRLDMVIERVRNRTAAPQTEETFLPILTAALWENDLLSSGDDVAIICDRVVSAMTSANALEMKFGLEHDWYCSMFDPNMHPGVNPDIIRYNQLLGLMHRYTAITAPLQRPQWAAAVDVLAEALDGKALLPERLEKVISRVEARIEPCFEDAPVGGYSLSDLDEALSAYVANTVSRGE